MSFQATLWQIAVNGIFHKIPSSSRTKDLIDRLTGSREEIAAQLADVLIDSESSNVERKTALVLLLTPSLKDLHAEFGNWPWPTFADLSEIEWLSLTSDQLRDAYYLIGLVTLPDNQKVADNLRRLALDLAQWLEPAQGKMLKEKFDVTKKTGAIRRSQ